MTKNQELDVYKQWLEITAENRPLTYYQLLKLKSFEDNTVLIRKQYRGLNAHIRKFSSGEFSEESQRLLNELAKAMLCLTDADRKAEYDASLGRKEENTKARKTFDEILLANNICSPDQMKKAKSYADAVGLDLYQAALQHKLAAPDIIMLAYAESIGLPFINLEDVGVDEEYAQQISPILARQHSLVPVMVDQGKLILASPRLISPDVEEELRMLFEMPVRPALCTPSQINEAVAKYYPKDAVQMIAKKAGAAAPAAKAKSKKAAVVEEGPVLSEDEKYKMKLQGTILGFNGGMILGVLSSIYLFGFTLDLLKFQLVPLGFGLIAGLAIGGTTLAVLSKR